MDSETNQKSSYRKIKQRQNFSNSPNQQQQQHHHNHHHPQQQSQRIRIHQENHRSRSWYQKTNSENQHSKENEIPAVKILAKSNKLPVPSSSTSSSSNDTNSQHQDTDTNSTSTVNSKPRPSPSFLEKNIQPLLKVHSSQNNVQSEATTAVNKQPKYVKIVDFEFNFTVQPDTSSWSIVDSWLLPDSNSSNHQTSNSTSTNCTAASGPSSSNIKQGFSGQSFSIVAAVGLDGVGKSSLLNSLAQCDVFETRKIMSIKNRENPLNHVTNGIDMHITCERVFLLDTQPLLSASVLENLIRLNSEKFGPSSSSSGGNGGGSSNSTSAMNCNSIGTSSKHFYNSNTMSTAIFSQVVGFDIAETENFAFIYSLQMLTFLLSVSDHLIIVMDSFCLDVNLFKLLATSLMMVGDALMAKANIIIYFRTSTNQNLEQQQQQQQSSLYSIDFETRFRRFTETILGPNVNVDFIHNDEQRLINKVLRPPNSRSLVNLEQSCASINYHSEHQWFQSAQKFWDTSILKSTLFADYARYLP